MRGFAFYLSLAIAVLAAPAAVPGQSASPAQGFDDCIRRYAAQAPSPQAAVVLQRACFYKHRYAQGAMSPDEPGAEHRKLSKIYTPEVCDCIFDKMPRLNPNLPATSVLEECVKNAATPAEPSAR